MNVNCKIWVEDAENEDGDSVESTVAKCERCGHKTKSFGMSGKSINRCLLLMRQKCPAGEKNFYSRDPKSKN
jgi:hypothetical protein